jgi:hypothetical protein
MKVNLNTYVPCIHAGTRLRRDCSHKELLYQYLEDWVSEDYYFESRLRKFVPVLVGWRGNSGEVIDRAWDLAEGVAKAEDEDLLREGKVKSWKQGQGVWCHGY